MKSRLTLLPLLLAHVFAHADDAAVLPQVDVQAERGAVHAAKSYSIASDGDLRDRVNLGLLGKANAFTAPITVVNYDEKAVADTEARTLVDMVAKKDASTWQFGGETNTLTGLYFRGYQLDARQFSVNGLAGMYGTQGTASVHVGSAQLIKGANTALNGMDPEGSVSGSLNIETKKAADAGNRTVGLAWFADSRVQGTADLGQRFGSEKQFGLRFNTKLRHGDTPRDNYGEDNKEFALNADYRGEKLRLSFDSVYAKRKTQGGRARIQDIQNADAPIFAALSGKTNLAPGWQAQTTRGSTNMLTFEWDAFEQAQISGGIGYNDARYQGNFASPTLNANGLTYNSGRARLTDQRFKTLSLNLGARGQFETGPVSHQWSAAYDRVRRTRQTYQGIRQTAANPAINPAADLSGQLAALDSNLGSAYAAAPSLNAAVRLDSLALSDTLSFADGRYRLTAGGRFQRVEYEDKVGRRRGDAARFSPMLMAAWLPSPDLVVYGNYMEDLEPADLSVDDSGNTTMADPRVSRQFEVGVRKNWGGLVGSLTAFQITRPGYWWGGNATGNDLSTGKRANTDFRAMRARAGQEQGRERNRGVEFNLYATLLDGTLRPNFGVMYLQSRLKDYPNYKNNLANGVQVANPSVVAKAGIEWDTPFAKGLTLTGHVQHIGKSYQRTDQAHAFPAYTLVDVGARYQTQIGGRTLKLAGTVENLFNKKHWQIQRGQYDRSFAVLGMPRTYWLKAELAF